MVSRIIIKKTHDDDDHDHDDHDDHDDDVASQKTGMLWLLFRRSPGNSEKKILLCASCAFIDVLFLCKLIPLQSLLISCLQPPCERLK